MIGSFTQGHRLPMVAPAAILGGVGRVHSDEPSASFFRFAREMIKELRPGRVTDAFRKTMIVNHPIDMQIFNTDGPERVDNLARVLMREVVASPFGSFMPSRDDLTMHAPLFRSLLQSGMLALHLRQCLFFTAKETRVGNFFSAREGGKGFESNINAHGTIILWQSLWFTLHRKGDVPFSGRGAMNGTGLDRAFDLSMVDHFDRSNLREADTVVVSDAEATLRIGDAIVATIAFKTRIARFLPCFAASEKGFIGQIDTHRNILP
jgi:hypothetical protein